MLADRIAETKGAIVIYGGNPAADSSVAETLKKCDRVLYIGTHKNETAQLASLVLPVSIWAEEAGIFVNKDGRLQSFAKSVARPGSVRDGWRVLNEILVSLGLGDIPESLTDVRRVLTEEIEDLAGLDLDKLPVRGLLLSEAASSDAPDAGGES